MAGTDQGTHRADFLLIHNCRPSPTVFFDSIRETGQGARRTMDFSAQVLRKGPGKIAWYGPCFEHRYANSNTGSKKFCISLRLLYRGEGEKVPS
jgi:hypothetical protein